MRVAVVGVTGMVGNVMLEVLKEHNFPVTELIPVASEKSIGKKINFKGKEYSVIGLEQAVSLKPDVALFSAGASVSKEWAPRFAQVGTTVVDNSSAWRMDETKKLVIPEINADVLTKDDKIIANPNCSTIQMLVALAPLQAKYGIKRIVVSTYQSITGTGVKAVRQLENEYKGEKGEMAYHYPIHRNAIPHCDVFEENGYTKEEMKMVYETQKILHDESIQVVPTTVRVPVYRSHSESVLVETAEPVSVEAFKAACEKFPGLQVKDNPAEQIYPMPLYTSNQNDCEIGRIRKDLYNDNGMNFWIVGDQIRKGAALNALQIAEYLVEKQAF